MDDALPPLAVPDAELAVARAIARRLGRPVFAVVTESGRRLVSEPEEPAYVAYAVDPRGRVRYGPAGRPVPPPPGAALVRDPASIPADELAAARAEIASLKDRVATLLTENEVLKQRLIHAGVTQ